MKKQLLLFLMMLLPVVASAHDIAVENDDGVIIYYNFKGTELSVTYQGSFYDADLNEYTGNIVIPDEVTYMNRTRKVTSIGEHAFFYCPELTSVIIPNSVTSIGEHAFERCSGLTSVTMPSSVTSIGEYAFSGCSGLTSVTIPSSVTSIGEHAFESCTGLLKVIVSDIGAWCRISFRDDWANPMYYAHHLYSDENTEITDLVIPNSVRKIGRYAFYECSGLTSVTIGNSVTSIEEYAFSGCSGLTSVTMPSSVTRIGDRAFSGCSGLTSITIGNSVTFIGSSAFYGCSGLTSITIPNSVTSIGDNAFRGCSGLTSVTIGVSVTFIGSSAFYGCSGLTSVTIGNSVTSIGIGAFGSCYRLTSITIPNSVTSIGDRAFAHCSGLTSVTIGNSVRSIGEQAFNGVYISINTVISLIKNPLTIEGKISDKRVFSQNTYNNATLYVPKGTIEKYKATGGWKDFLFIEESGTTPPPPPTPEKCEKPSISYVNGKLTFTCATEGATCHYSITDADIKTGSGNEVQLGVTYNISVYAAKTGYENSKKSYSDPLLDRRYAADGRTYEWCGSDSCTPCSGKNGQRLYYR